MTTHHIKMLARAELPRLLEPQTRRHTIARSIAHAVPHECANRTPEVPRVTHLSSPPRRACLIAALICAAQEVLPSTAGTTVVGTNNDKPDRQYVNTAQGYALVPPMGWERKDKAGADVLFEDPARRSSSLGVTVSPVRVASIEEFGGLDSVGSALLEAERKKESTLGVSLLTSIERLSPGSSGARLYEYEYELDSTRGRKRVINTVTIHKARLYILNAAYKCEAGALPECATDPQALSTMRDAAMSFQVL
ncbi:PsbP-domain-containing protein [Haematococcus lacustris]